jgi:hypothetical protein
MAPLAAAAWGRLRGAQAVIALVSGIAVADGLRRGFDVSAGSVAKAAVALAAVGVAGWGARLAASRWESRARITAAAVAGAVAAAAVVAVGYSRQRDFMRTRYADGDPAIAYFARNAPGGHKVGIAGVFNTQGRSPVLPSFGPRLRNEVSYVGHFVRSQLREYETAGAFRAAVARGGYDLLVIGKGSYEGCRVPGAATDERRWANEAGYKRVAESDRAALYRVPARGRSSSLARP